jgi:hypothetical protein
MEPRRLELKSTSWRWIRLVVDDVVADLIVEVVVHPEDDVAAVYGVVDVEPLLPRDEYSWRTTRLT